MVPHIIDLCTNISAKKTSRIINNECKNVGGIALIYLHGKSHSGNCVNGMETYCHKLYDIINVPYLCPQSMTSLRSHVLVLHSFLSTV